MKKTLLSLLALTLAAPAFAGETFIRDGWPGEYPLNFKVKKSVTVPARSAPESAEQATLECKLPRGAKYGPQSKGNGVYLSRFQIRKYTANKDIDLFSETQEEVTKGLVIKAGEQIEELAYWAEGYCQARFAGKVFSMSCPGNGGSDFTPADQVEEPSYEQWMNVDCGGSAGRQWVLVKDLESLFEKGTLESFIVPY